MGRSVALTTAQDVSADNTLELRALTNERRAGNAWTALRYFNLYRLIIAGIFSVLGAVRHLPPAFASFEIVPLANAAMLYLAAAVVLHIVIELRWLRIYLLRNVLVLIDITALTFFMHASGGPSGGFGILLVVAVAGACLIATWRAALMFAALAALAVLGETVYGSLNLGYMATSYTQAGLLGAGFFATAGVASVLAEQARRSDALATASAIALEQVSQLNEHIVQRMRSGIVVLDAQRQPVLVNAAAGRLLATDPKDGTDGDYALNAVLRTAYEEWQQRGENRKPPIKLGAGNEVILSFTQLGQEAGGNTLVFVEDAAEMQQRAQQLKLASLGRLTASIAHEIRNPLSAISHAAQLLSESGAIEHADKRLTQIIFEHTMRMNEIIKNVLMIGRREISISESFKLNNWLDTFVADLRVQHALHETSIKIDWQAHEITVRMDPSQLHQVLWNLCENALRYSTEDPKLRLVCGVLPDSDRPFVEVIDMGKGMSTEIAEHVFEPFYTGEKTGTGLGLYLARELCEANQATLTLLEHGPGGCRFRILFAHPGRRQLSAAI